MPRISKKLLDFRTDLRFTQEEFANKLGISRSYLKDIETGRVEPSRNFLEKIHLTFGLSLDWLFGTSRVVELIEANKKTPNPDLIFIFAFTQEGIEESEKRLRDTLSERNAIFIDAQGKTITQVYREITASKGKGSELDEEINKMLLFQDIILVLKGMSLAKIPQSGQAIRGIFKIIDDYFPELVEKRYPKLFKQDTRPTSSIIVLDYPSYLEKNMESSFGYYAVPIYLLDSGHPRSR